MARGMELSLIDYTRPLREQGPFNAIIHKLRPDLDWESDLLEYSLSHPEVRVIDSVHGIRTLRNRGTMLTVLKGNDIIIQEPFGNGRVYRIIAPPQVQISEDIPLQQAEAMMAESGMKPPLVVKPVWTDGREGSHGLAVVHDMPSLSNLLSGVAGSGVKPPVVIQEFVDHGGVLFKVYVLGEHTAVSKRTSLGDNYLGEDHGAGKKGITQLGRISCKSVPANLSAMHGASESPSSAGPNGRLGAAMAVSAGHALTAPRPPKNSDNNGASPTSPQLLRTSSVSMGGGLESKVDVTEEPTSSSFAEAAAALAAAANIPSPMAELPPKWFTDGLAGELRRRLGMDLFNFDLLRPEEQPLASEMLYYVIDINYFPGVDKIQRFEERFVHFLHSACTSLPSPRGSDMEGGGTL